MDATKLLIADHNRVKGLFARFKKASESEDVTAAGLLVSQIMEELRVHTTIEEEIFYPAAHEMSSELADAIDEGVEEHHVVKVLLGEIEDLEPGNTSGTPR